MLRTMKRRILLAGMIRVFVTKAGLSLAIDQNWKVGDPLPGSNLAFSA